MQPSQLIKNIKKTTPKINSFIAWVSLSWGSHNDFDHLKQQECARCLRVSSARSRSATHRNTKSTRFDIFRLISLQNSLKSFKLSIFKILISFCLHFEKLVKLLRVTVTLITSSCDLTEKNLIIVILVTISVCYATLKIQVSNKLHIRLLAGAGMPLKLVAQSKTCFCVEKWPPFFGPKQPLSVWHLDFRVQHSSLIFIGTVSDKLEV